ncbi:MAG: UDP-N-acetylmuramoyl-tripeptide--D-alanyl-D-alanine ligase [Alphaproteobacteria bacterium]|jgi:UDP-N-acetylmuramoyl-tripeptide--D-alanyl-D-alanine ligase|nr:UDP-N-acetylmuramoyl-tripeptide--D-alanyl-D-alanine ligase [Alphaproteobacteria bacterium]
MGSSEMGLWTNQEIAAALALPEEPLHWNAIGVSIDTRTIKPGDLYIAIRGDTHDGHAFVADAFKKGAVAAIVDHPVDVSSDCKQILVKDTLSALTKLGAFARQRTKATIIAVTGSVGKTSTKEMLRHVLSAFGNTFASPASFNNHWGVPLSLATMPRDTVYSIFEVGMNHPGEIAPLASLARPHIGVITAIADAHIGFMESRQAIVEEKIEIFSSSPVPTLAIINQDCPEFEFMKNRVAAFGVSKILGFGKIKNAQVRLLDYLPDKTGTKGVVEASISGQKVTYILPQLGEHVAINTLIALAIGEALGLDQGRLIEQLEVLPAVDGRGKQHRIPVVGGEILLIDDAYNANLSSMKAGLSVLGAMPVSSKGRRLVVLGEMLELGNHAEPHHQQLMASVLSHPIDLVFAAGGPVVESVFKDIPKEKSGGYASHVDDLLPKVLNALCPGDVILVKGSKGSKVSKIVDTLIAKKV